MFKRVNPHNEGPDATPRTREILGNERWYGNGPPQWRVGRKQGPAQTADEAHGQRHQLVKRLHHRAAEHPGADAVANRLEFCAPGQRCMSGACPECNRACTRWFVTSASALLKELAGSISVLSLVHAELSVPVGQLTPEHIQTAKRKVQAILNKAGITTFVGGIDFSANEHKDHEFNPYYQLQAWILAPTDQVQSGDRELRRLFPRTETTPRPVKILSWDKDLAALAYALKNSFDRRVSIRREASHDNLKHACRNTRDRDLRVDQHLELMIVLDRAGLQARLHLGGCRVVHTADGPEIRLIKGQQGTERL